ncbi:hypothetical protein CU071_12235, partial [Pseudomonas aeruginosa]
PMVFDAIQAERLARDGAILVEERCGSDPLLLIANGSYQLEQMFLRRAMVLLNAHGSLAFHKARYAALLQREVA